MENPLKMYRLGVRQNVVVFSSGRQGSASENGATHSIIEQAITAPKVPALQRLDLTPETGDNERFSRGLQPGLHGRGDLIYRRGRTRIPEGK